MNDAAQDLELRRLNEIDSQWSDGQPYDKYRLINEARFYFQQSAESLMEAGRRLILIKEHEPDGDFQEALQAIGIQPRAARKMMQAAVKFVGAKSALATLGKAKLLELLTEDDDELEALAAGDTLAGKTLDEIDRMTRRELRESLRKEKQTRQEEAETHEKLLLGKDQKINDLDKALHYRDRLTVDERTVELNSELASVTFSSVASLLPVEALIQQILEWDEAPRHLVVLCNQAIKRIRVELDDLNARYMLSDVADDDYDDSWMGDFSREKLAGEQQQ